MQPPNQTLVRSAGLAAVLLTAGLFLLHTRSAPIAAAAEPPFPVTVFPHARVAAGFRKGGILFQDPKRNYQVHTSRRERPGEPELHELDTDLFYIQEGSATFITGGTIVNPREDGPHEVTGTRIQGGTPHKLTKGDVIIIPRNTPHWFRDVSGTFTYYTIKVR